MGLATHIFLAKAGAFVGKVLRMFGCRHNFLINYSIQDRVLLTWILKKVLKVVSAHI
jgi:hypothetical protein